MVAWIDFFPFLKCINCGGDLDYRIDSELYRRYPDITGDLRCVSCERSYPLFHDIPIMFNDYDRTELLIDRVAYKSKYEQTMDMMKQTTQFSGSQLEQFRNCDKYDIDSIGWEILFWERWKEVENNTGVLDSNRDKINEVLMRDSEGGGRLRFFDRVVSFCNGNIKNKHLLNIGAGRDFLLERFLDAGCNVIEQDIVLESLYFLKKRGATFCICSDARCIPFKDDTFDISTSFGTLHHIWPIEMPIAELLRVTKGNINFNEPNFFALIRIALLFPDIIRRKLKQFHSADLSHSPYEAVINPYSFKKIAISNQAQIKDLSFPISSWISNSSNRIKRLLRMVNIFLTFIIPITSSHFDAVITKKQIERSK